MIEPNNETYVLVDEEFLSQFSNHHLGYMKQYYYSFYESFCKRINRKALPFESFYKNMHFRRMQLYQLCCPYCGAVSVCILDKKIMKEAGYNFCHTCGRGSTLNNIKKQLSRFIRINKMNHISLEAICKEKPETEKWLIAYDCYQVEITQLASIIEILLRDYFEALLFISSTGIKNDFISKVVSKHTGNDFMNIEKANSIYKKAYNIDLKKNLSTNIWNDLIDIVNLRNMIVHNNGMVDSRFSTTPTHPRWKDRISGSLIRLEDEDVSKFLGSTIQAVTIISNLYLKEYYQKRNKVIANYYFNHSTGSFTENADI